MAEFKNTLESIVRPFALMYGISLTTTKAGSLRDIGRQLDKKSLTIEEALPLLNKFCDYNLQRNDLKKISEALHKLAR